MSKVKTLDTERFESAVLGKEGLVMIHLYHGDDYHRAFEQTHKKFKYYLRPLNVLND